MDKQKKMISAILIERNRQIKGTIYISSESITFIDNYGKEYNSQIEWKSLRYSVRSEKVSVLLFIKQTRPLFSVCDGKGHNFSFIADQLEYVNYREITNVFEYYINEAKNRELKKKRVEEALREQERIVEEKKAREEEIALGNKRRYESEIQEQERIAYELKKAKEFEEAILRFVRILSCVRNKNERIICENRKTLLEILINVRDVKQLEERRRLEAEKREQERLEAEARRREEELRLIREEEERREQDSKLLFESDVELEQVPRYILDIYGSNEAEIALSCGASVVFEFWINAFISEDVYEYLTDSANLYDEVVSFLNYYSSDRRLERKFENLIEGLYADSDMNLEDYEDEIEEFLMSVCEKVHPHYFNETEVSSDDMDFREVCKKLDAEKNRFIQEEVVQQELISDKEEKRREKIKEYQRQYELVLDYVRRQRLPFTNQQIVKSVMGTTKSVVQDVFVREDKILNFYKEYMWYDNLNISVEDETYIERKVLIMISDYDTHHISELFDMIHFENDSLLNRYMLTTPHRLFSVVKYICRDFISTDRPYVARYGVKIRNAQERLFAYVSDKKTLSVRNLIEYADENYMQIGNIIQTINGLNGTHLLLDKHNMFKLNSYGVTYATAKEVENIIFSEVKEKHAMGICELTCYSKLPNVDIQWNEWLLYSILNKWSSKLYVDTVGINYKSAIPIVSLDAFLFESEKERIESRCRGMALGASLDISDVDAVLEDALEDILADLEI